MNCDELPSGGYCEVIKAHVPKSYCAVCTKYNGRVKYPSKLKMGTSFAAEGAKWAASGFKTRTQEEQEACMAICQQCDYFVAVTKAGPRCKKCGCCMSLKKRWATSHCKLKPPRW